MSMNISSPINLARVGAAIPAAPQVAAPASGSAGNIVH